MVSSRAANAVAGRTARACDYCVKTRARWYCAADDAFLCQSCDSTVHSSSAKRRHHRVRLKTTSVLVPKWESGFTRKPRTPRRKKVYLAPEGCCSEERSAEEVDYRVPILNSVSNEFVSSEIDLSDFAADVESLLVQDVDETFGGIVGFDSEDSDRPVGGFQLRLNYEDVLSAWDCNKSAWTTGERPDVNSGDCIWPGFCGESASIHLYPAAADGGREARVSRYREKRRMRLFSKKIRYEVRKLNAEKRPRIKGRFVKRQQP